MKAALLLALAAAAAAAPFDLQLAEEVFGDGVTEDDHGHKAISCKANTYYWGYWQESHYCVQCKTGRMHVE